MARGTISLGWKKSQNRRLPTKKVDATKDSRSMEERLESIESHWTTFGPITKRFLLRDPNKLSLQKFLDFFMQPDQIASALMSVIKGTAHMLAYEYLNVGAYENAKALTLCGAFFEQVQCADTPMEKIMTMRIKDEINTKELPIYCRGIKAIENETSNASYLRSVLPLKHQRITGFERPMLKSPGPQYTDLIADDWNGTSNSSKAKRQNENSDGTEITIVISNKDDMADYKKNIKVDTTLKSLFNGYADLCGVSLRSLRFAYNGSTLFLSSVGQKSPRDMCMKHMDTIIVSSNKASNPEKNEQSKSQPKARSQKRTQKSPSKGGKGKQEKRALVVTQKLIYLPETGSKQDKLAHSKLLSRVFDEMNPKLKVIRRQLNDLVLDRQSTKTKNKNTRKKTSAETPNVAFNSSTVRMGGKAGKISFVVNVGRVENLYKTSKRDAQQRISSVATVDLHGCTQEEALRKLGASVKKWTDAAMYGSYPWVIPAVIVCGGGNQILSETVEVWIKQTNNVANAPKGSVPY